MPEESITSPKASGGAGTVFEQHVGAYWLGQLVAGAIPPIWTDATVTKVHFQTEHLGWRTDDFLVECSADGGGTRRLACHVRSNFRVSASGERFKTAVEDFWGDYNIPTRFSSTNDRLVLVTQRGTANLLEHFAGLLDCARVARSDRDFRHRLEAKGFVSKTVRKYWGVIFTIIREVESREEEDALKARVWQFLRVLHVLSLDLATSTRQSEAQLKSMLGHLTVGGNAPERAQATWDALLRMASESAPRAASLVRSDLPGVLLNARARSAWRTASSWVCWQSTLTRCFAGSEPYSGRTSISTVDRLCRS